MLLRVMWLKQNHRMVIENNVTFFPGLKFARENMWFHYRVIKLEHVTASPASAEYVA